MDGISGITGVSGGVTPIRPTSLQSASGVQTAGQTAVRNTQALPAEAAGTQPTVLGRSVAGGQSAVSLSSLSVNQSSEMLAISEGSQAAITSNELLGAVLLLLILEYMKSDNEEEKSALLNLAMSITELAQQSAGSQSSLFYMSSSLSIESTQMTMVTTDAATSAYTNAGVDPTQSGDASAGNLDVLA